MYTAEGGGGETYFWWDLILLEVKGGFMARAASADLFFVIQSCQMHANTYTALGLQLFLYVCTRQ